MTRILSLTATGRLAERLVREAGGQLGHADLVAQLAALDVDHARARAGVRLAQIVGRLEAADDAEGATTVSLPTTTTITTTTRTTRA